MRGTSGECKAPKAQVDVIPQGRASDAKTGSQGTNICTSFRCVREKCLRLGFSSLDEAAAHKVPFSVLHKQSLRNHLRRDRRQDKPLGSLNSTRFPPAVNAAR